jgi:hypothetical protein
MQDQSFQELLNIAQEQFTLAEQEEKKKKSKNRKN